MDLEAARNKIREILRGDLTGACVQVGPHCRQRMRERQAAMDDVFHALLWGEVTPGNNPGDAEDLVFRVMGHDLEGEALTVVVKIDVTDSILFCLSIF